MKKKREMLESNLKTEFLNTKRLKLRKLTPDFLNYLYSNLSDTELIDYLNLSSQSELNVEKEKLSKGLETYNKSFLYFHLLDINTGNVIGWCGYHLWFTDHNRAEIGYVMTDSEFKGKGLMTEAIKSIITYGFSKMCLNRIEAFVGPENVPSIKLLKKFNFVQEGYLIDHYITNGKTEDSLLFSLLKKNL